MIVSVGIFRVLGSELAELPLVATTRDYQGQVISFDVDEPSFCFLLEICLFPIELLRTDPLLVSHFIH